MKEVYPDYADQVAFYAVGSDPRETLDRLEDYRQEQNHPWPVAVGEENLARDLDVLVQSTKIAFDANGIITYRAGYGQGDPEEWRQVFEDLASSP